MRLLQRLQRLSSDLRQVSRILRDLSVLFLGPTGVGKTELAKSLAELIRR